MAYFERADERDKLIICNICSVNGNSITVNERGITNHRAKCSIKHPNRFKNGELERCQYDSSHIVKGGMMSLHLEFCTKYQNKLVGEYQEAFRTDTESPVETRRERSLTDDSWNREANSDNFISELADKTKKLSIISSK